MWILAPPLKRGLGGFSEWQSQSVTIIPIRNEPFLTEVRDPKSPWIPDFSRDLFGLCSLLCLTNPLPDQSLNVHKLATPIDKVLLNLPEVEPDADHSPCPADEYISHQQSQEISRCFPKALNPCILEYDELDKPNNEKRSPAPIHLPAS